MHVLVTGAAGFIGSHVCERLVEKGHVVAGYDNFDPFYPRELKEGNVSQLQSAGVVIIEGDIRDRETLRSVFEKYDISHVIHLAALAGVRPSVDRACEYIDVNVRGTQVVLEEATRAGVAHVVISGSASVYAGTDTPFREDTPAITPASPYAASKRAMELVAHAHSHLRGTPITSLRFFSVYGKRIRPDLAIPLFVSKIEHGDPIHLFGDGSTKRDYTYISDIVDGIELSLDRGEGYEIINLGSGTPIALIDMVRTIEEVLGKKAVILHEPQNPADAPITHASIEKAKEMLGFEPKVSFKEGIARYIDSRR